MSRRTPSRFSLLAVQSVVCGVIVLLALLLRLIGGTQWELLRTQWRQMMFENAVAQWFDEEYDEIAGEAVSVSVPPPSLLCGEVYYAGVALV